MPSPPHSTCAALDTTASRPCPGWNPGIGPCRGLRRYTVTWGSRAAGDVLLAPAAWLRAEQILGEPHSVPPTLRAAVVLMARLMAVMTHGNHAPHMDRVHEHNARRRAHTSAQTLAPESWRARTRRLYNRASVVALASRLGCLAVCTFYPARDSGHDCELHYVVDNYVYSASSVSSCLTEHVPGCMASDGASMIKAASTGHTYMVALAALRKSHISHPPPTNHGAR